MSGHCPPASALRRWCRGRPPGSVNESFVYFLIQWVRWNSRIERGKIRNEQDNERSYSMTRTSLAKLLIALSAVLFAAQGVSAQQLQTVNMAVPAKSFQMVIYPVAQ